MSLVPGVDTAKRVGAGVLVAIIAAAVFGLVVFGMIRLWPRHDPTPTQVARKDEKAAASVAAGVGQQLDRQNADATVHLDITQKDIRDAFDAPPAPAPSTPAGEPRAIPAAPVDRLHDLLNEGAARANRAAGPSGAQP